MVPIGASHLTMFIAVQGMLLFHAVVAWEDDFTGYVVDYGAWPDQQRSVFTLRDTQRTPARAAPGAGLEGAIYAGLEALTEEYLNREWRRDAGAMMRIERCLIDANWGTSTDVVYQFCRQSAHAGLIMPSHGRYVGVDEWNLRAGAPDNHRLDCLSASPWPPRSWARCFRARMPGPRRGGRRSGFRNCGGTSGDGHGGQEKRAEREPGDRVPRMRLQAFPGALHSQGPWRAPVAPPGVPPLRAAGDDLRAVTGEATLRTVALPTDADRPIPDFQTRFNVMRGNGLRQIHIVFPVDCVWPLCTTMAGNCLTRTGQNRSQAQPNARKNRLAVMYRLAVHNVKTRHPRHSVAQQCASVVFALMSLISNAVRGNEQRT